MVLSDNGMESYVFPVADLNGAAKPEQSKTVNITANGTQTVTPDSGKVLSSVVINTNVPAPAVQTQEKSVEITQNGDSEVTPDAGKYLSKVNISVNVPTSSASKLPQMVDGSITTITEDDLAGATSIRNYAFYYCESLTSMQIPASVTSIGDNSFNNCVGLTSITIPEGVTSIGTYSLAYTGITNITIPSTVTSIENGVFYDCESLTSITIHAGITSIGHSALRIGSSTNKATITMLSTTPPTIEGNTFTATRLNQIIVPAGCGDAYKAATNWANFADYIVEATE